MRVALNSVIAAVCSLLWLACISYAAPNKGDQTILFDNHFKPGTAELTAESDTVLKDVLSMLDANPDVGLRIRSFTNNQGSAENALKLSQQRARTVLNWLVQHGVNANRLKAEDLEDSRPAAASDMPENRDLTNRVELVKFSLITPNAFLPVTKWEFEPVIDGQEVIHDFAIQNRGNAPLNIERVKTG